MKHRTAVVTGLSVTAVVLAAGAAIAANLGILSSATDTGDVGSLTVASSVTSTIEAPPSRVVTIDDTEAATTVPDPSATTETVAYAVGDAGVLTLESDGANLRIVDARIEPGWKAAALRQGAVVEVGFVNVDGTVLRFIATYDDTGQIQTTVDDLTPVQRGDDDRRGDDDDDDEHGEREGRDDDD